MKSMGKIDSKIIDKIEIIKQIIISRSLLRNHRSSLKWTEMEIEGNDEVGVVELILYVEVTEINCDDCSFEPEVISHSLIEYRDSIYDSIKTVGFDKNLNIRKGGDNVRGVSVERVNFNFGEMTVEFGIYIDPNLNIY
jgi:hypothetical protein